jgi:hypothetical protein
LAGPIELDERNSGSLPVIEIWRALEVREELVTRPEVGEVLGPGAGAGEGVAMGFPVGGELTLGP